MYVKTFTKIYKTTNQNNLKLIFQKLWR